MLFITNFFYCQNMSSKSNQLSILDFFDDNAELGEEDFKILDEVEESQTKRQRKC